MALVWRQRLLCRGLAFGGPFQAVQQELLDGGILASLGVVAEDVVPGAIGRCGSSILTVASPPGPWLPVLDESWGKTASARFHL